MKHAFSLGKLNLTELNHSELMEISGGHNGLAYRIGHAVGEGVRKAGEVIGVVALVVAYIVTPKS